MHQLQYIKSLMRLSNPKVVIEEQKFHNSVSENHQFSNPRSSVLQPSRDSPVQWFFLHRCSIFMRQRENYVN